MHVRVVEVPVQHYPRTSGKQTGANPRVVLRAFGELLAFRAEMRKVEKAGVTFRSHLDGAIVELSPERAIEVQTLLGSDIVMQLDECSKLPAPRSEIERAVKGDTLSEERRSLIKPLLIEGDDGQVRERVSEPVVLYTTGTAIMTYPAAFPVRLKR